MRIRFTQFLDSAGGSFSVSEADGGSAGGAGVDKMRAHPAEMIAKGQENWKTLADSPYR